MSKHTFPLIVSLMLSACGELPPEFVKCAFNTKGVYYFPVNSKALIGDTGVFVTSDGQKTKTQTVLLKPAPLQPSGTGTVCYTDQSYTFDPTVEYYLLAKPL